MKRVYQTIVNTTNGNCTAAVWASIFRLDINEVPNFVESEDEHEALCDFIAKYDYNYLGYVINDNRSDLPEKIKAQFERMASPLQYGGVNGYYHGTVYSPAYFDRDRFENDPDYEAVYHSVVVDKNLNIVHDPNPAYAGLSEYPMSDVVGHNGILGVTLIFSAGKLKK